MSRSEFTVADAHTYDHRSTLRWLQSHILRYKGLLFTFLLTTIGMASAQSMEAITVGWAFDSVLQNEGRAGLTVAVSSGHAPAPGTTWMYAPPGSSCGSNTLPCAAPSGSVHQPPGSCPPPNRPFRSTA